jgi:hypothetical protein
MDLPDRLRSVGVHLKIPGRGHVFESHGSVRLQAGTLQAEKEPHGVIGIEDKFVFPRRASGY